MADPAVIREAFWSWGKVSNSSREKVELKLGGILRIVGSCPTELVSISNFHIVKKSISSLPCTARKGHSSVKDRFCPPVRSKGISKGILPKERLLSTSNSVYHCLYPTQHQYGTQERMFPQSLQSKRALRIELQLSGQNLKLRNRLSVLKLMLVSIF